MKKLEIVLPSISKPKNKSSKLKKQVVPSVKRCLQLVNLADDLAEETREEANKLGFMSRLLLMVNLPYRDPGAECRNWWRKNGNVSINVTSGYKDDESIGIPYGAYPRLILAYLVTQAVKTNSPQIFLGQSFSQFITFLGVKRGGKQYKQLQLQLKRTLSAAFSWTYETDKRWSRINIQVSHESHFWWDPVEDDNVLPFWESYIKLNTDFFNEIIRHTVPLDLRVLSVLKNSPLGLDLYMFISWRVYNLNKPIFISWESLQQQLGGQYADVNVFSRDCRMHITRIKALRPDLKINFLQGRLLLKPSFYQN